MARKPGRKAQARKTTRKRKPAQKTAAKKAQDKAASPKRKAKPRNSVARAPKAAQTPTWAESTAVQERIESEIKDRIPAGRRKNFRSLVMVSGGVESVCILANLLKWTTSQVHAHFIINVNKEQRFSAESAAIEKIVHYCRENIRDFEFSASWYELMLGLGGGLDLSLQMFMAARVNTATGGTFEAVWTGHIMTPWHDLSEGAAIFAAANIQKRMKPRWILPVRQMKKVEIYKSMPRELGEMTWSCRTPVKKGNEFTACGKCHSCKSMKAVRDSLAADG